MRDLQRSRRAKILLRSLPEANISEKEMVSAGTAVPVGRSPANQSLSGQPPRPGPGLRL